MTWKFSSLLAAVAAMGLQSAYGFVYVSDFTPNSVGDNLAGADGWTQSEANPAVDQPLSWIGLLNGQKAGAVGTYYGLPAGSSFFASRNIGVALDNSRLSMNFSITDSTTDFPHRNNFSIEVLNDTSQVIFSFNFLATNQVDDFDSPGPPAVDPGPPDMTWNVLWKSGITGQSQLLPDAAILEGGLYRFDLEFTESGANTNVAFAVVGSNTYSGGAALTGMTGQTFSSLRIRAEQGTEATDWGDNFFSFTAVPEPASTLLLGLSSLLCLRRRR